MRQRCPPHATQTAVAVSAPAQVGAASTTGARGGSRSLARAATARRAPAGRHAFMGNARLPMISSVRAAALARIDAARSPPARAPHHGQAA
jgi:hypothetical protein